MLGDIIADSRATSPGIRKVAIGPAGRLRWSCKTSTWSAREDPMTEEGLVLAELLEKAGEGDFRERPVW